MRFLVHLSSLEDKPSKIPVDYRSRFISLLKAVFGEGDFINERTRPYTFAVYFGKSAKISKNAFEGVKQVNFRFSTGDNFLAIRFYNGILKLKKEDYVHSVGDGRFFIKWVSTEKEKPITGMFKTLSPVVVERMGFSSRNPMERYILPSEEGFNEALLENIMRRYIDIIGQELQVGKFIFEPIRVKEEFIRHYGGFLRGFIGKFKMESDSQELLRFIYQHGLGLRTGQGFGYLEVEDIPDE